MATIVVFTVLIACVVLSTVFPQWMFAFEIIGAAPVVAWYLAMMKSYKQNRSTWLEQASPPQG